MSEHGSVQRMQELLADLDVEPAALRSDPRGEHWLPEPARVLADADPDCARAVRSFVQHERALFEQAEVGGDPFFTARVLQCLPAPLRFTGLRPAGRAALLALFHVMALAVAYAVFTWATPGLLQPVAEHAHDWLELGTDATGLLGLLTLALVAVVAFAASRSHTRPA